MKQDAKDMARLQRKKVKLLKANPACKKAVHDMQSNGKKVIHRGIADVAWGKHACPQGDITLSLDHNAAWNIWLMDQRPSGRSRGALATVKLSPITPERNR
jgi:hypothetical protein